MNRSGVAIRRGVLILSILAMHCGVALAQQGRPGPTVEYTSALQQFFVSGGPIVWFVLLPLSTAMVAVAIWCGITIRRGNLVPDQVRQQVQSLIDQRQYREALEFTSIEPSMLSYVIHAALSSASGGFGGMERALSDAVDERSNKLLRRAEYMNIIGNISPMIGLFGTVYGMIRAFNTLVLARGTPEPALLAEGISTALVTTFWGLLIAIPALSAFAVFRNRIDGLAAECALAGEEMLSVLQPATRPTTRAPAAAGAEKADKPEAPKPPTAERLDDPYESE